jgi:integrase
VRDELLASNPAVRIKQPGVPRTGGHYLSIAKVACPPLLRLLVAKGLRHGEALALRWSDVDLTNGLLQGPWHSLTGQRAPGH